MQLHSEELRLLAQLGLMAAGQRDESAAIAIFSLIELARPQAAYTFIGPAMNHLYAGRCIDAIRCLERGLEMVAAEDRPELHALLAVACRFDMRHGQCERALAQAGDVPIAQALRREIAGTEDAPAPAP